MTPDYLIRDLDRTDEDFLREMLYHAIYVPPGEPPFPREILRQPELARYVERWGRDGDQGLIALDRSNLQPVGAAWIRLFTADDQGYGYVDDETPELTIALLPEHRNRGIGTDLLRRLIEQARHRYRALSLSVTAENPAARLYQRLGFRILARHGTALTMKKELGEADS